MQKFHDCWATTALALAVMLLGPQSGCSAARPQAKSDLAVRGEAALSTVQIERRALQCNTRQVWNRSLRSDVQAAVDEVLAELDATGAQLAPAERERFRKRLKSKVMWRQIRNLLLAGQFNNLGVVLLKGVRTEKNEPVLLFRTGFTPKPGTPGSCFSSLLKAGHVRHVANLYAGPMVSSDLERGEREAVRLVGGTYFLAREASGGGADWREHLREGNHTQHVSQQAMKAVAKIINDALLRPGGKAPTGNLHIHCGGGMHRTGMVVGVIDRCLNGTEAKTLESDYKRHVGWRSAEQPGGFEADNLKFILGFDCSLLKATGQ